MNLLYDRLRSFGAYTMYEDGSLGPFDPNPLTSAAADEIDRLNTRIANLEVALARHNGDWTDRWREMALTFYDALRDRGVDIDSRLGHLMRDVAMLKEEHDAQ